MRGVWALAVVLVWACGNGSEEGNELGGGGSGADASDLSTVGESSEGAQELSAGELGPDPGEMTAEVVEPEVDPGPRLRAAGWLRGDLHLHTQHSDGDDDTATVIKLAEYLEDETFLAAHPEYAGNQLDFIAITDHRTVAVIDDPDFVSDRLILIAGEEYGGPGHAGLWGITEVVHHDPGGDGATLADYQAGVEKTHEQGGCFSMNHPYSPGLNFAWDIRTHDAIEVCNAAWALGSGEFDEQMLAEWEAAHGPASPLFVKGLEGAGGGGSAQALRFYEAQLARQVHVALVGGSDRHAIFQPGFPTTWVRADSADVAGFLEGVRSRHTFVSRTPVAATVEMTVTVGEQSWEMGDAVPLPAAGTMVTVTVRASRAAGGLLRLISGHSVATDEELAKAALGHPVLELPLTSNEVETSTTLTVVPGDWLYPMVLEPLLAPGLAPEWAAMVPEMAANVTKAGVEDYDSLLKVFWDVIDFPVLLNPQSCDPAAWNPDKLQCLPPDATGVATYFVPDWVNRVLNVVSENNQPTNWCMGALGSAVLFVAGQ